MTWIGIKASFKTSLLLNLKDNIRENGPKIYLNAVLELNEKDKIMPRNCDQKLFIVVYNPLTKMYICFKIVLSHCWQQSDAILWNSLVLFHDIQKIICKLNPFFVYIIEIN